MLSMVYSIVNYALNCGGQCANIADPRIVIHLGIVVTHLAENVTHSP